MHSSIREVFNCGLLVLQLAILILPIQAEILTSWDVHFAARRCQNISTSDEVLRSYWSVGMLPDKRETHCYVKCFLSKLGLINLKDMGFAVGTILGHLDIQDENAAKNITEKLLEPVSGTCTSYYTPWTQVKQAYADIFNKSIFEYNTGENTSSDTQPAKQIALSATEYCDNNVYNIAATSASFEIFMLEVQKCRIYCIFRHFRYFDAYDRVEEHEILDSYKAAKIDSAREASSVKKCTHKANSLYSAGVCEMGNALNKCLRTYSKHFQHVYKIWNENTKYF